MVKGLNVKLSDVLYAYITRIVHVLKLFEHIRCTHLDITLYFVYYQSFSIIFHYHSIYKYSFNI